LNKQEKTLRSNSEDKSTGTVLKEENEEKERKKGSQELRG